MGKSSRTSSDHHLAAQSSRRKSGSLIPCHPIFTSVYGRGSPSTGTRAGWSRSDLKAIDDVQLSSVLPPGLTWYEVLQS